jgi:hypothetical protein
VQRRRLAGGRGGPVRTLTGRGQPSRRPGGGRRAIGTGTGICLIAVGAILRFAVAGVSPLGLNLHAVGVILIVVGVLGLLLRPLARGRQRPDRLPPDRLRRRTGYRSRRLEQTRRAAAADVAEMRDDGRFVRPDAPGHMEDDL